MNDEDSDPFVGGPPPDPSERAWRHPSEIAAEANAGAATTWGSGVAGRTLRDVLPLHHRSLGVILAGSLGAAACLAAVAVIQFGDDTNGAVDPAAIGATGVVDIEPLAPLPPDDAAATDPADSPPSTTTTTALPSEVVVETATRHVVGITVGSGQVASGVIVDGHVLTSAAAVGDELSIGITDGTGSAAPSVAYLVGVDPFTDLAVFRPSLETRGSRTTIPLRFLATASTTAIDGTTGWWTDPAPANADAGPAVGTEVAVASADDDGIRFEHGVVIDVDGEQQTPAGRSVLGLIDTSARRTSMAPGGLLVAGDGTAMGVVVDCSSSLASAVPLDEALEIADRLTAQGWASETWIGFVGVDLGDGVEVVDVHPGGPADVGGVQPGDVIAFLDGSPIDHMGGVTAGLRRAEPGDTMVIVVERDGAFVSLRVTAETYSASIDLIEPVGG